MGLYCMTVERFLEELKKCQLLCKPCHIEKTVIDRGEIIARGTHGTISSYRYCHCEVCRRAKTEWQRKKYNQAPRSAMHGTIVHGTGNAYSYHKCRCALCTEAQRVRCARWRGLKAGIGQ